MKFTLFAALLTLTLLATNAAAQDVETSQADDLLDSTDSIASSASIDADEAERLDPEIAADTIALPPSGWISLLPKCARPDSNFISLPGGLSPEMALFVEKLDSVLLLGTGRVSIVHIGGSHVQADIYTDEIRSRIDSLNNGLRPPHGLIFPYRVAKTNNPLGYRVSWGGKWDKARCSVRKARPPMGIDGITVWTSDPSAWISFDLDPRLNGRWASNGVKLLGRAVGPDGACLVPVIQAADSLLTPVAYDSLTTAYTFTFPKAVTRFTLRFQRPSGGLAPSSAFFVDGLIPLAPDDGIVYHSVGVNGAAVPHYLRLEYFERQMMALKPDLVIMAIGVNDASGPNFVQANFMDNYDAIIRLFRRINPKCAFIFISNNDTKRRAGRRRRVINKNGPLVQEAFAQIATKWQGGYWDLFSIMGGLGSMAEWQKAGLAGRDNIHFSRLGYKVVGALFYDAFLDFYLNQEPTETLRFDD